MATDVIDAIDKALEDYAVSHDAMRWTPDEKPFSVVASASVEHDDHNPTCPICIAAVAAAVEQAQRLMSGAALIPRYSIGGIPLGRPVRVRVTIGGQTTTGAYIGPESICLYCSAVNLFTGDGYHQRATTPAERAEIARDPELQRALAITWAYRHFRAAGWN
jgi:hypothetical protein